MNIDLEITPKQRDFINAEEFEVLFGGAAGGGKSYGQIVDALLFALKYPRSNQLIFRRTFAELEKSLIRKSREIYPMSICSYNASRYSYTFVNGSIIDFGYISTEDSVHIYQSAEYDVIRFDELTHFTESMYTYMISRVRGANGYPKHVKSSCNPGGIGHGWVKSRFIDIAPPNTTIHTESGTRRFIPAKVHDNHFLVASDPGYITRLDNLDEDNRRMLRDGDWDVFAGQYFREYRREKHVVRPFEIPSWWKRFRSMDWGYNDPCCVLWHAVDAEGRVYTYRELYIRETLARDVARRVVELTGEEKISYTVASPDMWQKRGVRDIDGENIAEIFAKNGVPIIKADNTRVIGWNRVREYLADSPDGLPGWQMFETCQNLIRTLPTLIYDDHNTEDVSDACEDHAAEALRYGLMSRPVGRKEPQSKQNTPVYDPFSLPKRKSKGFFDI